MEALKLDQNSLKRYQIDTIQNTKLGAFTEQNSSSIVVEKSFLSEHNERFFYKLGLRNYKNHNPTQNDLRTIENDLKLLNDGLSICIDKYGNIDQFLNLLEIKAKWDDFKHKFKKKHKKFRQIDQVIDEVSNGLKKHHYYKRSFAETEIGTLIFPPNINELNTPQQYQTTKLFSNFFEDLPLILSITHKAEYNANKSHLKRFGSLIDCDHYQQSIRSYFRKLLDNYKLEAKPNVRYIETFDFDNQNNVTYAGQILHFHIKNVFEFQQIVNVKPLNS